MLMGTIRASFQRMSMRYAREVSGPLAQLVEQLAFNQLVGGSSPPRPTIFPVLYQLLSALPR